MERGNLSAVRWFGGIGEYKIDWEPGYRIYLAKDGDTLIMLFGGGTKRDSKPTSTEPKLSTKSIKHARRDTAQQRPRRR
jgi:putative addiction module killer protein